MTEQGLITYLRNCQQAEKASTVIVTGHPSPDGDAVISALFEAWRLTKAGRPASPLVQAKALPCEVAWLLGKAAPLMPLGQVGESSRTLVLTDHHEVENYAGRVVAVIDHHPLAAPLPVAEVQVRPVGATTTLVAERLRRNGVIPDAFCARLLLGAILLDTEGLSPFKAKEEDRAQAAWLTALCGEDPTSFYALLQEKLLEEQDVLSLFRRDYRRYADACGKPLLGFAILKVWADRPPDTEAVRRLLQEELTTGVRVAVAKIVMYRRDGGREERYLAAGAEADAFLREVQRVGGEAACREAEDAVFLPETCVHRGRKWYAARLTEIFAKKAEK